MKDIYQIKISLDNAKPSIYRTILVEDDRSFSDFHLIIQITMGWGNYHLYQFKVGNYYIAEPDEFMEDKAIDPEDISLKDVFKKEGDGIKYEYDFGDGWTHSLKLEKILPIKLNQYYPICLRGKRSCPPEDCGGVWGYEHLKKVISDKKHPEHKEMIEWVGGDHFDPELFDVDEVNDVLSVFDEL